MRPGRWVAGTSADRCSTATNTGPVRAGDRAVASGAVSRRWFRRLGFLVLLAGAVRALQQALRPTPAGQAPPGPAGAPDTTPRAVPRPAASTTPPADQAPAEEAPAPATADEVAPPNESSSSAAPAPASAGTGTGGPAGRPSGAKKSGTAKKAPAKKAPAKKAAAKKAGPAAKKAATAKKPPANKSGAAKKAAPARRAPAAKKSTPAAPAGGDARPNDTSRGESGTGDTPPG
jgi:hypothetical protein